VGLDAYQKVIHSGVDLVILTTPPGSLLFAGFISQPSSFGFVLSAILPRLAVGRSRPQGRRQ